MPWQEVSTVSLREEFVVLASQEGANVRELCRRFGISPTTGYKWLARYQAAGSAGLADQSRRPQTSPGRTPVAVEAQVLALREAHPAWGGRKVRRVLETQGGRPLPSPSTITEILRRHGRLASASGAPPAPWQRFAQDAPNELWQMDFKGVQPLLTPAGTCHPLSVLDDHSRDAVGLVACADEQSSTVQGALTMIFRRYGLPVRLLCDNGSAWRGDWEAPLAPLVVWLVRLGIAISHGRPAHPQTQGKVERFHRTLDAEIFRYHQFPDLPTAQAHFDAWRDTYNLTRPHHALALATPASHYRPSPRAFLETLPPIEYGPDDLVRTVGGKGEIWVQGRPYRIGRALRGYPVALRPTTADGHWAVFFCQQQVATLDLPASSSA